MPVVNILAGARSMATASLAECVQFLGRHDLLEPEHLAELARWQAAGPLDPASLVQQLVRHRWLTSFQASCLLQGRGTDLVFGPYVLLDLLGEGGMGVVYKARHRKLNRVVALKVIRPDKLRHVAARARFHREIQAASQLNHPNIVLAYDASEVDGRPFIAMEFIEGIDLGRLVEQAGPLLVSQACDFARQAAVGLAHAHARGLIHRDVKPSNLLVSRAGVLKLLDLGLVRLEEADPQAGTLTSDGAIIGSPDFIAPEQAKNPHGVDARCDLYSLGCTLYFLLSGRTPFAGSSTVEKLLKHQSEPPPALEHLRPDVPLAVVLVVHRLMAKRPEDRFPSAEAVVDALTPTPSWSGRVLAERMPTPVEEALLSPTVLIEPTPLAKKPALAHPRRRVAMAVAALGLVAGLGAIALLTTLPPANPPSATVGPVTGRPASPEAVLVRRPTPEETILATLAANQLPTLEGDWWRIGPFDGQDHTVEHPPERNLSRKASHRGRSGQWLTWQELPKFRPGVVFNLAQYPNNDQATVYLLHDVVVDRPLRLPVVFGSDDDLTVWLNGERLLDRKGPRPCVPGQDRVSLRLTAGGNQLLLKVTNDRAAWQVYLLPLWPADLVAALGPPPALRSAVKQSK